MCLPKNESSNEHAREREETQTSAHAKRERESNRGEEHSHCRERCPPEFRHFFATSVPKINSIFSFTISTLVFTVISFGYLKVFCNLAYYHCNSNKCEHFPVFKNNSKIYMLCETSFFKNYLILILTFLE